MELYKKLVHYQEQNVYPMHMPGHKRNNELCQMINPYEIDITEIDGFDNLHEMGGDIKELSTRLAALYQAGVSFPLINGSTVGILAGILAATKKQDTVLIARNSHKSVYHAAILQELKTEYLYPERLSEQNVNGIITPRKVEEAFQRNKDIRLVAITSPTYEGIVSDIKEIARVVHEHGALLLVDEAHGAHLGFTSYFPKSAVTCGADLIIQSLHKTLPSFTQTAVLHVNNESLEKGVKQYLSMLESSSPSYILMASIDQCVTLLEEKKEELFCRYQENLTYLHRELKKLTTLIDLTDYREDSAIYQLDSSKIVLFSSNPSYHGIDLMQELRDKFHIEMEMAQRDYVLGMTSICDTKEGFDQFLWACHEIDQEQRMYSFNSRKKDAILEQPMCLTKKKEPYEAMDGDKEKVLLEKSMGRVVSDYICIYPPGSPVIVPGEVMSEECIWYLQDAIKLGLTVTGVEKKEDIYLECFR